MSKKLIAGLRAVQTEHAAARAVVVPVAKAVEVARAVSDSRGAAPLHAFGRQGAKEIGQVLTAFPDSVRVVEEAGTMGNPTPQLVTAQMRGKKEIAIDR